MKQRLTKILENINRLSLRERLLLFAAGLVIVTGVWEAALAAPLDVRERIAADKIGALQDRIQALDTSLTAAAAGMSEGMPNQFDRLKILRERVVSGDEELKVFTSDLVDPAEMRLVLEDLLRRQQGLRLVSATNLVARPLVTADQSDPAAATDEEAPADEPKLYRHTLVLTLQGSYLECLRYLQTVERLPWHLHWGRLELSVDEYPRSDIVLELRTLSLDPEWIGV